ncbi:MAG: hypothetical protein QM642_10085 [Edaphocola sp.]
MGNEIAESWALGVQWSVTNMEYRERGIANYGNWDYTATGLRRPHDRAYQWWRLSTSDEYTSLFINLVDDFNELGINFGPRPDGLVDDRVSGYALSNIQSNYLQHVYGLSSLATKLKANKPANVTDAQIDLLLSFY